MKKSGLSQETLKIIACVTMLIDHVGATVVESQFFVTPFDGIYYLYFAMRIIGRVAFPIYCFLLAEAVWLEHGNRHSAHSGCLSARCCRSRDLTLPCSAGGRGKIRA